MHTFAVAVVVVVLSGLLLLDGASGSGRQADAGYGSQAQAGVSVVPFNGDADCWTATQVHEITGEIADCFPACDPGEQCAHEEVILGGGLQRFVFCKCSGDNSQWDQVGCFMAQYGTLIQAEPPVYSNSPVCRDAINQCRAQKCLMWPNTAGHWKQCKCQNP